jgi:hypothetical protein
MDRMSIERSCSSITEFGHMKLRFKPQFQGNRPQLLAGAGIRSSREFGICFPGSEINRRGSASNRSDEKTNSSRT